MSRPELVIVVAAAENGVIGRDGGLPWRLPADLRHFKATTMGHPILMGRHTWDSIGRPLPGRRNLVISRQLQAAPAGCELYPELDRALAACAEEAAIMVIGGARLYAAALPRADRVVLTRVHANVPGDTVFPALPAATWAEQSRESHPADEQNEYPHTFLEYRRRQPLG